MNLLAKNQPATMSLGKYLSKKDDAKLNKAIAENNALRKAFSKLSNHVCSCFINGMNAKIVRHGDDCFFESGKSKVSIISSSIEDSLFMIDKFLSKKNGVSLEGKGFIYLVSDGINTKIGATTYNPVKRLNELQVGNAKELTLIGSYAVERRIATESLLHETYRHKNIRGEWFKLSGQDIVDIINNRVQSSNNNTYQVLKSKVYCFYWQLAKWIKR